MPLNESFDAELSALTDLFRKLVQSAYERGREDERQDTARRVMEAIHGKPLPITLRADVVTRASCSHPTESAATTQGPSERKRAPWGLVPKLIMDVAADHAGATMLTEKIAALVKEKTEHEIADSSIRSALADLAEKGEIIRLGRSEWRFPDKEEVQREEPVGTSADDIREPSFLTQETGPEWLGSGDASGLHSVK